MNDGDDRGVLRVLVVEDQESDAELMALRLAEEGFRFDWRCVQTEDAYLAAIEEQPDLIMADWHLPQFDGMRALQLLRERSLEIPFIIVSGGIGEEAAIDALRQGASDYVLKDRPARLGAAVRRALEQRRMLEERRRAEEKLRQDACVFESTSEGIMLTDTECHIVAVNPAFSAITGYSEAEVLGSHTRILKSGRHDALFYREMWANLLKHGQWRGEIWNRRRSGEIYPEWLTLSAVRNAAGETTHYVGVFSDISHVKAAQEKLDFLAHHDALTALPNRVLFHDRLNHCLERARRENRPLALLFIDLDRFKNVNDTLGHPVGDELLQAVTARMREEVRASDTLARLGGDEFVLLLEDDASAMRASTVARKLLELLAQPVQLGGHELTVTASIGISLFPEDGTDADTLVRHADRAMYEAKSRGRNMVEFFDATLSAGVLERLVMENALRGALARNELLLFYQPQFELASQRLSGVEALVRWQHPQFGMVPREVFIPLAEETGIIGEIGAWVLQEACRQMMLWQGQGFHVPRVAVNLSLQQVERGRLLEGVSTALRTYGLAPARLELEVTESMIMHQPEQARRTLQQLIDLGVQLAVDDFGTGYSSLAYLKRLPLHRLKIDQSFVADIGRDGNSEAIVRAVIAMARSLGLETVAEGVENAAQAAFLRQEGCDFGQGYLYSQPLAAVDLKAAWSERHDIHGEDGRRAASV